MITNLKAEKIEVRYSAKRIAAGAPRETGSFWYKVTGSVNLSDTEAARLTEKLGRPHKAGYNRVVLALNTDSERMAIARVEDITKACAIGADSPLWHQLEEHLPRTTFKFFAHAVGFESVVPSPIIKSTKKATWIDLQENYLAYLNVRDTSKKGYISSLSRFAEFLREKGLSRVNAINNVVIADFCPWRKAQIKKRKNAGKNGERLKFDLVVLRAAFNFEGRKKDIRRKAWLNAGFPVPENPVPETGKDGKPGAKPEKRKMPYSEADLKRLRKIAADSTYTSSSGQQYVLKHGVYSLAFELLLHTGIRREDACVLTWKSIQFDHNMIVFRAGKNTSDIEIPIHEDLLPALEAEYARQTKANGTAPASTACVLLNPETGDPYSRSGLNRALTHLGERLTPAIKDAQPHRFRVTFAVQSILKGLDVYRVAKMLGDTVDTVTKHYLPMAHAMMQQAADILNRPVPASQRIPTVETRRRDSTEPIQAWRN